MSETTTEPHLSDRELRDQMRADVQVVRDVKRKPKGKRTGRDLRAAADAAVRAREAQDELGRRAIDTAARSSALDFMRPGAALRRARELDPRILDGATLDHHRLDRDELGELRKLQKVRHRDATPEQEARYVELVEQAADEPGLFARRTEAIEREDAMKAEAAKLARTFLPRRRDPEPGSVELPAYLLRWLTNGEDETFDVTDLGVLAAVLLSFANESPGPFFRGTFRRDEDGPAIVIAFTGQGERLMRGADDTAHIRVGAHLSLLARNGLLDVQRASGTTTIRLGKRTRKLWRE